MTDHAYVKPGQVESGFPPPDQCVSCGQPRLAHDWRAMREWLIKARNDAQRFATTNLAYTHAMAGFQAQIEVLSAALDFMDARERAR